MFFKRVFGWNEIKDFEAVKGKLLSLATFEPVPSPCYPRERCTLVGANDKPVGCGVFSTPSVDELHQEIKLMLAKDDTKALLKEYRAQKTKSPQEGKGSGSEIRLTNVGNEANQMHSEPSTLFATIQAASQFNYLEFPSPQVTPEQGISGYAYDRTQGPACAIACAGGTAYRNYLVNRGDGSRGQSRGSQLNGLEDVETAMEEIDVKVPWRVHNGYVDSSERALEPMKAFFSQAETRSKLLGCFRIGVQEDVQVTNENAGCFYGKTPDGGWEHVLDDRVKQRGGKQIVTQTYNSAISIGYSRCTDEAWEPVAQFVLDGSYEATMLVGIINALRHLKEHGEVPPVLLTKVGGGVFANPGSWIMKSIQRSCDVASQYGIPLDVVLVHYRDVEPGYEPLEGMTFKLPDL